MSESLQEFVDSGSHRLRVDRAAGVIRGVKLLGLSSRNGRRYREAALVDAIGLYEGAKVNINHPKGHPLAPRDYQDRLGVVRGVQFRTGEGLFGDLHFNPRHALSEQLVWDAEHAPQNVGMSHNVLARTRQEGDGTVVEAITKVQSIDLVADPATTDGLYEHANRQELRAEGQEPEPPAQAHNSQRSTVDSLTLHELRLHRPDLVREIEQHQAEELATVQRRLDEAVAREALNERRERVRQLLHEHDLPLPAKNGRVDSQLVSQRFIATLMQAEDDKTLLALVEERAALVHAASHWNGCTTAPRPKSKDQLAAARSEGASRSRTPADFAAAIRGN
jgi:hypothetical protein